MDIAELCSKVDDDTEAYITSVSQDDAEVVIQFEIDDPIEVGIRRRYTIHTEGLVETKAFPSWCGTLDYLDDHPLLWDYNCPWQDLYFTTAPACVAKVVGILYETHERVFQGWRPLGKFLNMFGLQNSRNALLASGPEPLITEYTRAIQHVLKVNAVRTHRAPRPSKVLIFGDCFVICSNLTVNELSPHAE